MRLTIVPVIFVLALMLGACGSSPHIPANETPKAAAVAYVTAVKEKDPIKICAALTPASRTLLMRQADKKRCADVARLISKNAKVSAINSVVAKIRKSTTTIDGATAIISASGESGNIRLRRIGDTWLVDLLPTPEKFAAQNNRAVAIGQSALNIVQSYYKENGTFRGFTNKKLHELESHFSAEAPTVFRPGKTADPTKILITDIGPRSVTSSVAPNDSIVICTVGNGNKWYCAQVASGAYAFKKGTKPLSNRNLRSVFGPGTW